VFSVYLDLIEILLKKVADEFQLHAQKLVLLLVESNSDYSCHYRPLPCQFLTALTLVLGLCDFYDSQQKNEKGLTGDAGAIETRLSQKLHHPEAKLLVELEIDQSYPSLL